MKPQIIEQFVLASNRFAPKFKIVRKHLAYCTKCQQVFIEIATKYQLSPDVNQAIFPNFKPSQGALEAFADCQVMQPVLKALQKHSCGG